MSPIKPIANCLSAITIFLSLSACNHTPSEQSESLKEKRSQTSERIGSPQLLSASTPISEEKKLAQEQADVVLIGSELEGLYLAKAAADEGLRVCILDPRPAFGGQVLQGEMLFLDATRDAHRKSLVQGRVKELFDGFKNGQIRKIHDFQHYMEKLVKGIPVTQAVRIGQVGKVTGVDGNEHISSLTYTTSDGVQHHITASSWVENTDYAAFVNQLHVTRAPGLEKLYGQSKIEYMGSSYMMKFKHVNWKKWLSVFNSMKLEERKKKFGTAFLTESYALSFDAVTKAYKPTSDRLFLRGFNAINQLNGDVLINGLLIFDVNPADDASVNQAIALGQKEIPFILELFRKNLPGWENAELNGFPPYLYIREYNHYETAYTLQASDLLSGRMFDDNVSIGGYPIDLQGITANKWGVEMGRPDKYGIPLRSFVLKGYDNVLMAGKNVGASAIAYGSVRIQPNTSTAAESIGVLLGELRGTKYTVANVPAMEMERVQHLLAMKYHINVIGVRGENRVQGWSKDELQKLDTGEINITTYKHKK
ncbi:FAD-dependent oxidoreductase [Paenibacillus aestuarii]|uniref:FAD-dependent oxidoreductase n=1 Tax=Paenibacillus aestuarii TaxID=516965 RepID=A0ABW0KCF4_9BACL|nr:FAD-dependent oxidoreductase [Paenibacillus aestuarii]